MKKYVVGFILLLSSFFAIAQTDSTKLPPYQRFPTVPPIQLLLSDSSTIYTKAQIPSKKPVLIMIFNPECEHCQHETEEIIAHRDELKDVQIVMSMIAVQPLSMMKDFISKYHLNEYSNITVGKDIYYIMPGFYDLHNIPFLAMYDKKGDLIEGFEGSLPITKVIELLKKN